MHRGLPYPKTARVKSFYIIDGHYQIYRAFYGLQQPLTSPTGEPTGATHLFCAMLFGLIRDRKPDYLAMVMDVSDESVFRREIAADYKAHRDPAPEALGIQTDWIVTIVQALGVPIYRKPGFEADDLMATIAERLRNEDVMIYLVSRDKDLDQLHSDRVRLLDPTTGEITDPRRNRCAHCILMAPVALSSMNTVDLGLVGLHANILGFS